MPSPFKGCVEDKIPKLINEGYPQDQAVAIAYSMCSGKAFDSDDERDLWLRTFARVYADTADYEKSAIAADGMIARDRMAMAVKAATGEPMVEGWAILFTDTEQRDLDNTYFSKDTALLLDQYPTAPLWYEHQDGASPVGERVAYEVHEYGVWLAHKLYADHPLYERIVGMIQRNELSYSTDSLGHYVNEGYNAIDGALTVWPLAGCSLVHNPAEPGLGRVRMRKALKAKYDHIDFTPTDAMANEAQRGLDWRDEHNRGGTEVGIARARDIANRRNLSPDTARRMFSFFSRHEGNKQATGFEPGEDGYPSNGRIAWALWGGDPGFSWSRARVEQMDAADRNSTRSAEAREAQGAAITVEAQKAQDNTPNTEEQPIESAIKEQGIMNEEQMQALVQQLAAAFGVDATIEAVMAAMNEFMSAIGSQETEAMSGYDREAMRSAFGLADDASDDDLRDALRTVLSALDTEPVQTPARSVDVNALSSAYAMVRDAAKSAPAAPRQVGYALKSEKYGSINVNRNAPKPTIDSLVLAHMTGNQRGIKAATKGMGTKAQGTTENVLGGYLLNDDVAEQILPALYNESILPKLGVQTIEMDSETLTVRKIAGGATAYWLGEHESGTEADTTFGTVNLSPKEVGASNRVSAKLLRYARQAQTSIQDDMVKKVALAIDLAGLRGSGGRPAGTGHTGAEPRGVRFDIPSTQVTTLATNGRAPTISDINKAIADIKGRNILSSDSWGIAVSTRERQFLTGLTDTTGRPLLRERWDGAAFPQILGIRVEESNQIPTNLTTGTATDTSEIYVGDWQYAVLGIGLNMEVAISEHVYFNQRDIAIRLVAEADFGLYYREAFQVLVGSRGIIS